MKSKSLLLLVAVTALSVACTGRQTTTGGTNTDSLSVDTLEADSVDADAKYAVDLLRPGTEAPDFAVNTIDGKAFSLSSLRGQYVVLEFWASWCPDCRKDLPRVVALSEDLMPKGIAFVGVSHDTEKDKWEAAVEKYSIRYTQVGDLKPMRESTIARDFGVHWIPSYFLIAPDGRIELATVVVDKLERACRSLPL